MRVGMTIDAILPFDPERERRSLSRRALQLAMTLETRNGGMRPAKRKREFSVALRVD
jgi:hypothetical protein